MYFDEVKKNFGFGCMRLPMMENGTDVDIAETTKMVDLFLEQGFNYFDTAHGYLGGKSELALKECLTSRHKEGENLVNLPDDAKKILDDLHGGSTASYAVRFAASFEGIRMVLSGMSNLEQMNDNLSYMKDFKPLDEKEMAAVKAVADVFHSKHMIPCTACRYCVDGCPKRISIPDLFACLNAKTVFHDWNADYYYNQVHTVHNGKAGACIRCGKCEKVCPQHLKIRELLKEVPKEFEK